MKLEQLERMYQENFKPVRAKDLNEGTEERRELIIDNIDEYQTARNILELAGCTMQTLKFDFRILLKECKVKKIGKTPWPENAVIYKAI